MTPPRMPASPRPTRGSSFARLAAFGKSTLSQPWLGAAFLIVSFLIAQIIVVVMHRQTTRMWSDISEVQLARDLYREFYAEDKDHLRIANAIEACKTLYKGNGGRFSHLQINRYLGFFSDLDLFMQRGLLSTELAGHFFGPFIIEAYEYPELKDYIRRTRENFGQPRAFQEFDRVAEAMEADPRFARLTVFAKTMCEETEEKTEDGVEEDNVSGGESRP